MAYEFQLGPYLNARYGPNQCPWGGPTEGDDHDHFFLTRGEEDRFFFDSNWGEADWKDWEWRREADQKQRLFEKNKRDQQMIVEDDVTRTIVLMPRKVIRA